VRRKLCVCERMQRAMVTRMCVSVCVCMLEREIERERERERESSALNGMRVTQMRGREGEREERAERNLLLDRNFRK